MKINVLLIVIIVTLPVVFTMTLFTDLVIEGVEKYYWGAEEIPGPLFIPFLILFVVLPIIYTLALFYIQGFQKRKNDEYMPRMERFLVIGGGVILLGSLFTGIFSPACFD
jgi:hypothetical protein